MKPCYKVVQEEGTLPSITKVEPTDLEGTSWREAKKTLRQWYLDQAYALREVTEQSYFNNSNS